MRRVSLVVFPVLSVVIAVMFFSSCKHTKMATCRSNNYQVTDKIKRPHNKPLRIFEPKYRPVRKNYVIRNGIAY